MRRAVRIGEDRKPACARCLRLEDEREIRQRQAASGQYVAYSPGPSPNPDVEDELRRWLAIQRCADAADGFRAGWTRLARVIGPRLQDWEARWLRARRANAGLKSHNTALVAEIRRLEVR
jgi:hypothetical protein